MKQFLILLGVAVAGVAGYLTEPSLRFQLTGLSSNGTSPAAELRSVISSILPSTAGIDPTTLPPEELPEHVNLKVQIKFADESSGLTMTVMPGSQVKLIRIDGKNAVVRPGSTAYTITLPISKTDLLEQLVARSATAPPVPAVEPTPDSQPAASPDLATAPTPSPTAGGDSEEPAPIPEPVLEPKPTAQPQPAPQPTAGTASPAAAAPGDVLAIMRESIRSGQIKEFSLDQVLDWNSGAEETVDDEAFQTGTVSYKAETIFGVKTIQAKALIQGGKVLRWIWPKSGMEIK